MCVWYGGTCVGVWGDVKHFQSVILIELEALAEGSQEAKHDGPLILMARSEAKFLASMISSYNEDYEVSVYK